MTTAESNEVAIFGRILEARPSSLSPAAAQAWLNLRLAESDEQRLKELAAKSKSGPLPPEEADLLEAYLQVGRLVDTIKSKARRSLKSVH